MTTKNAAAVVHPVDPIRDFICHEEPHAPNGAVLGFWLYLMSDCFIFAALFACVAVLGSATAGGPTAHDILDLPGVALSTGVLLVSSFTFGLAMLGFQQRSRRAILTWLAVSGALAVAFVGLEVREFAHLIAEGAGPDRSAFLSSFFALVGTHGLHVTFGVLWLALWMIQMVREGFTARVARRLACLSLFWHFLDLVWIGVFSYVYLVGVVR